MSSSTATLVLVCMLVGLGVFGYSVLTHEPPEREQADSDRIAASIQRFPREIRVLLAEDRLEDAARRAWRHTRRAPNDPEGWLFTAIIADRLGEHDFAETAWRRLDNLAAVHLRHRAHVPEVWHAFGWARAGLGDEQGAVEAWAKAAELHEALIGEHPLAGSYYNLACYRALAGDKPGALEAWARSLERGWTDFGWALADPDLRSIHEVDRFLDLLAEARNARSGATPPRLRAN